MSAFIVSDIGIRDFATESALALYLVVYPAGA